jgi:hypothetical protein
VTLLDAIRRRAGDGVTLGLIFRSATPSWLFWLINQTLPPINPSQSISRMEGVDSSIVATCRQLGSAVPAFREDQHTSHPTFLRRHLYVFPILCSSLGSRSDATARPSLSVDPEPGRSSRTNSSQAACRLTSLPHHFS